MTSKTSFVSVLITQGAIILIGLLTAFGVELEADQVAALTAAAAFLGIIITIVLWTYTVPREKVLEVLIGSDVVAGEANDMVLPGTAIRAIDSSKEE